MSGGGGRAAAAVHAAVREHWGLRGELYPLVATAASRTWRIGDYVVKLARDEPAHFAAGLRASEAIEQAGVAAGAVVRTQTGELCRPLSAGPHRRVLAVMRRAAGAPLSLHDVAPAVMGGLLGRLHRILSGCPTAGAWTPADVLGHMARGITAEHPPAARMMITQAIDAVRDYYRTGPPMQLLRGDGPEILSVNGADITAIIDWGGVRVGSVADDIGCWTAHGATDQISLSAYTAEFLDGYCQASELAAADRAAVPLFQRLRIASRACHVTSPAALADAETWMNRAFSRRRQ